MKLLKSSQAPSQVHRLPVLGSCVSLHLFWLLHKNIRTFCGCPGISRIRSTERTVEMDTQVLTCCGKRTRRSTPSIKAVSSAPIRHHQKQQIRAGFLPCASTPALANNVLRLTNTVWPQDNAKIRYSELVTAQPHLQTCPHFERFANTRLQGEEILPVEHSICVVLLFPTYDNE